MEEYNFLVHKLFTSNRVALGMAKLCFINVLYDLLDFLSYHCIGQRSRVRFPALPDFLSSSGSQTGSTQPL
jgi:hypothetical protein